MARTKRPDVRSIAEAIIRRAPQGLVLMLSDPPTLEQRLHLMAARIDGRPLIVMAPKPAGLGEGNGRDGQPNAG